MSTFYSMAGTENANDLLDVNMQSISNELDALLVGNEAEMAIAGWKNSNLPALNLYQLTESAVPLQYPAAPHAQSQIPSVVRAENFMGNRYVCNNQTNMRQLLGRNANIPNVCGSTSTSPPAKVNFQYLRSFNKKNPSAEAVPLISVAALQPSGANMYAAGGHGSGNARKFQKPFQKYRDSMPKEEVDYDKIVVDLSLIGLSIDGKEQNAVVRLFGCFRTMHYYLNDIIPSSYATNTCENISLMPPVRASMPCTMNVQQHVKQAARKCNIFIGDMERILNANKLFDRELYLECERSLNALRQLLNHFEIYKRIELEHKRGLFVTEEGRAQAESLELLIQQINERIRETHIYVHVFNWSMEQKCNPPSAHQLLQQQEQLQAAIYQQQRAANGGIWSILTGGSCTGMSFDESTSRDIGATTVDIDGEREPLRFVG